MRYLLFLLLPFLGFSQQDSIPISNTEYIPTYDFSNGRQYLRNLNAVLDSASGTSASGWKLTPSLFGAAADGTTDDSDELQAMFDYGEDNGVLYFDLEGKSYKVGSTVFLPDTTAGANTPVIIENGTIVGTAGVVSFQRTPVSDADDVRLLGDNIPIIRSMTFVGGSIGLYLGGTYSAVVENSFFANCDTGLVSSFSLSGKYLNLRFTNCQEIAFLGNSGAAWGASQAGSSFNANVISGCRIFNSSNAQTGIYLTAADGNLIENCITEGGTPQSEEIFIHTNLTVTRANRIRNHWSETTSGVNVIVRWDCAGQGQFLEIDGLQKNTPDTIVYVENGPSSEQVVIRNPQFYGTNVLVGSGNTSLLIENDQPKGGIEISDWITGGSLVGFNGVYVEGWRSEATGRRQLSSKEELQISVTDEIDISNDFAGTPAGIDLIFRAKDSIQLRSNGGIIIGQSGTDYRLPGSRCSDGQIWVANSVGTFTCVDTAGLGGSDGDINGLLDGQKTTNNVFLGNADGSIAFGANDINNTSLGVGALTSLNNSGSQRTTAVGFEALNDLTSGDFNTALGAFAGWSLTTGGQNTIVGANAFSQGVSGANTIMGYNASPNSGGNTTAIGYNAINDQTTATFNTAAGVSALESTTNGSHNTAIGYNAGNFGTANTTGDRNIFIGSNSRSTGADVNDYLNIGNAIYGSMGTSTAQGTNNASITIDGSLIIPGTIRMSTGASANTMINGDGDGDMSWIARYQSGTGSPSGVVTPRFIADEYLDTNGPTWYKAHGTGNTDWTQITN